MQKTERKATGMTFPARSLAFLVAMLWALALPVSASVLDDAKPITIVNADISVRDALNQVKSQSGVALMYQSDIVDGKIRLNLKLQNVTLKEALDAVCTPAGLQYTLKESYVLITKAKMNTERKPKKRIKGMVMDKQGEPLIGATVYIEGEGSTSGVITDFNGRYELEASPDDLLVFSYVGMAKQAIAIGKNTEITVTMYENSQMLNDVVVTGFQTISKERATGAFDILKQEALEKPSVTVADRLVGKVAGVQAATTSDGDISFIIRGRGTLQSDEEPLIVVDGFPISSGFASINPNDVENISILKDAAAASIWGARASNGVIVVTTKKGSKNKGLNVEVNAQLRIGSNTDIDYLRNMLSSAETIEYQRKTFGTYNSVYKTVPSSPSSGTLLSTAYDAKLTQAGSLYNRLTLGEITENEYNEGLARLSRLDNSRQIKDDLLKRPIYQQYNVILSGATSRMMNYVSLLYGYDTSRYQGSKNQNFQIDYRGSVNILKWLDMNISAMTQYKVENASGINAGDISGMAPYDMIRNEDGTFADMSYLKYYVPGISHVAGQFPLPYSDWGYNVAQEVDGRNLKNKTMNNRFQVGLRATILEGLTFDTKFQLEHIQRDSRSLYSDDSFYTRDIVNRYTTLDWANKTATSNIPNGSIMDESKYTTDAYNWRNQVNFTRTFIDRHAINFVGGVEIMQNKADSRKYAPVYGYDDEYLTSYPIQNTKVKNIFDRTEPAGIDTRNTFSYANQRYFSAFANIAYTLDEKYSVSASYRTDASNFITDDPKYRYSPFWSVGFSWNMTREKFMKSIHFIDYLRPRITYGCNGNANTSTSIVPLIEMRGVSYITGENYANITTSGNPKMTWERTNVVNVGLDWSMFNGRFHGKLDYYNKKGTDILANISVPMVSGQFKDVFQGDEVMITANAAEVTNRGFELELGTNIEISKNFRWDGNVTMAYNKNKVDKFYVNFINHTSMLNPTPVEGHSIYGLWAYEYTGLETKDDNGTAYHIPTVAIDKEGNTATIDNIPANTDGRDAMKYMGTAVAPWTVSTFHTFTYKYLELSFTLIGKFGHKFRQTAFNYADPMMAIPNRQYSSIQSEGVLPMPDSKLVNISHYSDISPYMSYNVKSANHVRMQELTLAYSLPTRLLKKWGIGRLTCYLQGNNLFTIKATDEDPEYAYGSFRLQPTYTFGVKFAY